MDPLSITVSVSTLLVTAAKVIRAASDLRSQYKDAAFMLSAISSECTVINTSLAMLQSLMVSNLDNLRSRMTDHVMSTFEVALMGCALTMGVVEDELSGLLVKDEDGNLKARRIKYMMDQDHLKEMLQQIRGQQIGVTLLLQTYQAETTAEVNKMAHKNNALLRQIANRGRSFYLESIHDGERRASVARSFRTNGLSDFEMCSIIDDRQFDFDDEIINAGAYRRALATLRHRGRFQEEIDDASPTGDRDESQASTAVQDKSSGSAQADTNDPRQKTPLPSKEGMMVATHKTYEPEPEATQPQHAEQDYVETFADFEWMLPKPAKVPGPLLDPRTDKALEETEGPLEITDAQMIDLEQKAIASRGVLPLLQSAAIFKSKDEIQAMIKDDKGRFGFSDVGGSSVTAEELKQQPTKYRTLKFVVAGDGACGKTYAVMKYLRGHTEGIPYAPTVWANYTSDIKVDGYYCQVSWEDTTGQEDYDRLRPLSYPNCDVALLFFAINSPDSLDNIQEKWAPEIYHFLPYIPKILVGCKTDLRYDPKTIGELAKTSQKPVSRQQAEEVARLLGVGRRSSKFFQPQMQYMECSSFTGEGVKEIFEEAARLGIRYTSKKTETKPRRMSGLFRRRFKVQPVTSIPEEVPRGFAIQTQYGESPIQ